MSLERSLWPCGACHTGFHPPSGQSSGLQRGRLSLFPESNLMMTPSTGPVKSKGPIRVLKGLSLVRRQMCRQTVVAVCEAHLCNVYEREWFRLVSKYGSNGGDVSGHLTLKWKVLCLCVQCSCMHVHACVCVCVLTLPCCRQGARSIRSLDTHICVLGGLTVMDPTVRMVKLTLSWVKGPR